MKRLYIGMAFIEVILLMYFLFYVFALLLPGYVWDTLMINALLTRWWFLFSFFVFIPLTNVLVSAFSSLFSSLFGFNVLYYSDAIYEYLMLYWNFSSEMPPEISQYLETGIFGIFGLIYFFIEPLIYFGVFLFLAISVFSLFSYLLSPNTKSLIAIFTSISLTLIIGIYMGWINFDIYFTSLSITSLVTSDTFIIALFFFFTLEFGFYIDYVKKIVLPSAIQEEIILRKIHYIEQKAKQLPKIKETSIKSKSSWLANILSGDAFYFVRDILESRRESDHYTALEDEKTARKLSSYLTQLKKFDPGVIEKITGKTYLPSPSSLIQGLGLTIALHFVALVIFVFIVFNTPSLFAMISSNIYILQSVEMTLPEATLLFLLPLSLSPVAFSMIVKLIKKRTSPKT